MAGLYDDSEDWMTGYNESIQDSPSTNTSSSNNNLATNIGSFIGGIIGGAVSSPRFKLNIPTLNFDNVKLNTPSVSSISGSTTNNYNGSNERPQLYKIQDFENSDINQALKQNMKERQYRRWLKSEDYTKRKNAFDLNQYDLYAQSVGNQADYDAKTLADKTLAEMQANRMSVEDILKQTPERTTADWNNVKSVQNWLNTNFNSGLDADNMYGKNTNNAITAALQRTDLTEAERQGLTNLQNSYQNGMVGQKKLISKNFGKQNNTSDFDQLFTGKQYQKVNLKDGTHAYQDVNSGNVYYNNGRMKFKNGAMGSYSKGNPDQPENEYDYKYREKGYIPKRLKDGSYQYVDPQNNFIFFNNGRYIDPRGNKGTVLDNGNLLYDRKKQGGILINKHQQGGTMVNNEQELQKAFMAFLIEDAATQGMQIQSEEDLKQYVESLGQEGIQAKYQEFMQLMSGASTQKPSKRLGGHLNYLKQIKGACPDGEETYYFKEGGSVKRGCKPCMEKAKKGAKFDNEDTDPVNKFKCGRKVKKAIGGSNLGLKGKISKYNEPDPKNPQTVLYDNHGNSVISEKGYFIKRRELPNNKIKDDTIKSDNPIYNKIKQEFNKYNK